MVSIEVDLNEGWHLLSRALTTEQDSLQYLFPGAVSAFTKALALEMGEHNITVNTIIPGDIDTADQEWTPQRGPRNLGDLTPHLTPPVSRPGRPEEVADLALFLSTDDSRFITGTEIVIDGGATIVEPLPTPP